jgi:tRNA nucleotidyltransferase (CCA-adding enzyme)
MRISQESIRPLVLGRDLIALGIEPGPEMGKMLKRLYTLQLDNAFEDKAGGLRAARQLVRKSRP